ncbi:MAG: MBOAT family protein [Ruminococcaceae bacterium]|nr:MBOAT family protein [Oscillospiraceae bacterium]
MLFTSYSFIFFILAVFFLYYTIPKGSRWPFLLCASYIFYFIADPVFPLFILATTAITYFAAIRIGKLHDEQSAYLKANKAALSSDEKKAYKAKMDKRRTLWYIPSLLVGFGILAVIKYTNFVIFNVNSILTGFGGQPLSFVTLILPMGISFYTFQSMGYLIDVKRKKYAPERNFFKFALFVSFFPQLVQGPISRFDDLAKTLFAGNDFDSKVFSHGIRRILWGFFKKVVIADRMLIAVNELIDKPEEYRGMYVVLLMLFYAIELYADFTGGIDITIGVAEALGITVKENFERPYFSKNIEEYWRRWHITMGTWFRDYIFYPLSISTFMQKLSKKSREKLGPKLGKKIPVYLATLIVWFATGIWHGASWNFIVWGLLNGVVIIISQECSPLYAKFHEKFPKVADTFIYRSFTVARTFWLMCALRLLDCYRDVPLTFGMFGSIFTTFNWGGLFSGALTNLGLTLEDYIIILIGCAVMLGASLLSRSRPMRDRIDAMPFALRSGLCLLMFLAILVFGAYGTGYDASQFIYNQF